MTMRLRHSTWFLPCVVLLLPGLAAANGTGTKNESGAQADIGQSVEQLNSTAKRVNALLAEVDAGTGGKYALVKDYALPTNADASRPELFFSIVGAAQRLDEKLSRVGGVGSNVYYADSARIARVREYLTGSDDQSIASIVDRYRRAKGMSAMDVTMMALYAAGMKLNELEIDKAAKIDDLNIQGALRSFQMLDRRVDKAPKLDDAKIHELLHSFQLLDGRP